jgi:hypothetical protein
MQHSLSFQALSTLTIRTCLLGFFLVNSSLVSAQVSAVSTLQNLSFGTFSQGAIGGTITISTSGLTTTTGSIFPLTFGGSNDVSVAIFEVEAPVGSLLSFSNGPDVNLKGSNGGTMVLHLGPCDPKSPFAVVSQTGRMPVNLGGTLTVGSAASAPPGNYAGTFYITFNNE